MKVSRSVRKLQIQVVHSLVLLAIMIIASISVGGQLFTINEFARRNKTIVVGIVIDIKGLESSVREAKEGRWETDRSAAFILVGDILHDEEKRLALGDTVRIEVSGSTQIVGPDSLLSVDQEGRSLGLGSIAFVDSGYRLSKGERRIFALSLEEGIWRPGFVFILNLDSLPALQKELAALKAADR